jgi:hypothetical protein
MKVNQNAVDRMSSLKWLSDSTPLLDQYVEAGKKGTARVSVTQHPAVHQLGKTGLWFWMDEHWLGCVM